MIQITDDQIIINIPHPCPKEAVLELQAGIIETLQYQYANPDGLGNPTAAQNNSNYMLLELLKATLDNGELKEVQIKYLDRNAALREVENIQTLLAIILRE